MKGEDGISNEDKSRDEAWGEDDEWRIKREENMKKDTEKRVMFHSEASRERVDAYAKMTVKIFK